MPAEGADLRGPWALAVVVAASLLVPPVLPEGGRSVHRISDALLPGAQPGGMTAERRRLLGRLQDVNSATVYDLADVPGIGALAPSVISLRDRRGGFHRMEELMDVKGIGPVRFRSASRYLLVSPSAGIP